MSTQTLSVARPRSRTRSSGAAWSVAQLGAVRRGLERDRERFRAQVRTAEELLADPMNASPLGADDEVAHALHASDLEGQLLVLENTYALLLETEHALQRVEDGSYPFCRTCGATVGKARQQAFPRAITCLSCKQRSERA